jgi:hypothetical protein
LDEIKPGDSCPYKGVCNVSEVCIHTPQHQVVFKCTTLQVFRLYDYLLEKVNER